MTTMTHRQRVLAALNHKQPDAVPFDFGGCKVTSLNVHAYDRLKPHLGVTSETQLAHFRSQRTHMAEEMSSLFDSDLRRVHVPYAMPMLESVTAPVQVDEWGSEWTQSEDTGLFFVSRSPLASALSTADVDRHPWPEPDALAPVAATAAAAARLRLETDCAICLDLPDGVVHISQFLRGFDQWLVDMATGDPVIERIMDYITDIYVAMVGPLLDAVGDNVDVVLHCDDIAIQRGPLVSPRTYRRLIKPRQARILDAIKAHTPARLLYHSCGSVRWVLGDLIDMGVDAVNPVQVSAAAMDTAQLKREFGDKLTFWGGIDTHHVLPFGTPQDVYEEVRRRIEDLSCDGGYVIGSVHIVQGEVPPQNLLAYGEAVHALSGRNRRFPFAIRG